jgi:hypothetical protein
VADTGKARFDTSLAAIMWVDGLLSAALAAVAVVVSPLVATVGVPHRDLDALGAAMIALAALLAACGAITAVLIAERLRAGEHLLPAKLRLPLPTFMRPPMAEATPEWPPARRPGGAAARSRRRG